QRLAEHGLLDSTLVFMSSDLGDPARHSVRNVPTLLAGGAQGRLKMGRRIVLGSECPSSDYDCASPRFTANNKLLVTIAQAFGVQTDRFGTTLDPALSTGALAELL